MTDAIIHQRWVTIPFEEVVQRIVGGGTPSKSKREYYQGDIPWMSVKDMNKHVLDDTVDHISQKAVDNSSTNVIPAGTPIVATRMSLGKIVVANFDSAINQDLKALFLPPQIDRDYLVYWYRSMARTIEQMGTGTTVKGIRLETLKGLKFALSPLAEQKIIADKLDTLLAQVENTKARLEHIPKILKRFRQSVLSAAVSGQLTEEWRKTEISPAIHSVLEQWELERIDLKSKRTLKKSIGPKADPIPLADDVPDSWTWVTFEHIAEHSNNALKAGPFGSALKKSDCVDSGFKVYGQEQVIKGEEGFVTYYVNSQKFQQLKACSVKSGDILISLVGTIGKILILSDKCEPGVINPRLVKLSLQPEISREYVKFYLESPLAHDFFRGFSHGGTMQILNLSILKELPILLPTLDEQTEIVRRVDQLFAYADTIEKQVNNALTRVNNLTQSILAKAFRGELTEQWRKDNPELISGDNSAEALLARIKTERVVVAKPKRRKSKA